MLDVTGTSSFTDTADAGIDLGTLQSNGAVTVDGGATTIVNDSALALQGTVTGNLVATATTGGISDSAVLDVTGTSSFTDSADAGINLGTLQSNGAVTVDGGATTIVNDTALKVEGTVTGTLNVTATSGGISDSGTLTISGEASFTDTDGTGINLGTLAADSIVAVNGGNVEIVNDSLLKLQGNVVGTLYATATTGGISDSGILAISGTSTFTDVENAGIDLGTLQADSTVTVSGGNVALVNDAVLTLQGTATGTLSATATTGGISDTASLEVADVATFTDADNAGINLGTLKADSTVIVYGGDTSIVNDAALALKGSLSGTLNASGSAISVSDFQGKNVNLDTDGAVTATGFKADVLQVSAGTGVDISAEGVDHFAAQTTSGDIAMVNVGGYAISDISTISDVSFASELSGVQFTDTSSSGKISLIAQSPLTINAPINAGQGSVLLVASGSSSTDDVTINSQVTANSAEIYAGDTVDLAAQIVATSTYIQIGTNYNAASASTSTGSTSGDFVVPNITVMPVNLTVQGPSISTFRSDSSGRVIASDSSSLVDYQNNQIRGVFEEIQAWDNISISGFVPTASSLDNLVEPENSGDVEIKKKK